MLERNRKFGRVSRPADSEALTSGRTHKKQRRSGSVTHAANSRPKPTGKLQWEAPKDFIAVVPLATAVAADNTHSSEVMAVELPANAVDASPPESVTVEEAIADVSTIDSIAAAPDEASCAGKATPAPLNEALQALEPLPPEVDAVFLEIPDVLVAAAERPLPRPRQRKLRPALRWAAAVSVVAIGLLALGRLSDAHLPLQPAPVAMNAGEVSAHAASQSLPLVQVATLALLPLDAVILPPTIGTAAHGTDDLIQVAALPPATDETLTARDAAAFAAPAGRITALQKPAQRPVAARNAASRATARRPQAAVSHGLFPDLLRDLLP